MEKKICLIIPTKDRPRAIEAYLASQAELAGKLNIDILIQDSSAAQETQRVVQTYQKKGIRCLKYVHYKEKPGIKAIDDKVKAICCLAAQKYDHLCFSSDGTIIRLDRIWTRVLPYMEREFELIVNGDVRLELQNELIVDTPECLLRKCVWRMLSLGSTIVSSRLMRECLDYDRAHEKEIQDLWIPMVYFRTLASRKQMKAVYLYIPDAIEINPYIQESFWRKQGLALWQWGERWCKVIDSLPTVYDAVKRETLLSHDRYRHVFSPLSIVGLRAYGNFSLKDIKQYKMYIPMVTDTPVWFFYLAAVLIRPWFAMKLKEIYKRARGTKG